ncbi:polysaccharide biosynthesis protein [Parabacteroides distasonis]|uniref:UDP-glucose 4-epimerase n=1 Tax=Parabacteroides distasonis TaxID=823 RepID=A0A174QWT4_PARDI|nr:polysaccharide biosynthesis protein [Parabacteroides distasonis]CUP75340.1 UDP-glucose 4-epimerase [Parabacteroides distasonis]
MMDFHKGRWRLALGRLVNLRYINRWIIFSADLFVSLSVSLLGVLGMFSILHIRIGESDVLKVGLSSFVASIVSFLLFKAYHGVIRHSTLRGLWRIGGAAIGKSLLMFLLLWLLKARFSPSIYWLGGIMDSTLTIVMLVTLRVFVINVYNSVLLQLGKKRKRVLVFGTEEESVMIATSANRQVFMQNYSIMGFLSFGNSKKSIRIAELPVYQIENVEDLYRLIPRNSLDGVLFPNIKVAHQERDRLIRYCEQASLKTLVVPEMEELRGGEAKRSVREIRIEDLLGREEIHINLDEIGNLLEGKTVLVTGAAGSIGSEICRQLAHFPIKKLVCFDSAETPMHNLRLELEENPCEAIRTNVFGTRVMADAAVSYGVEKFVMISTDKAVNPTNIMGCSKRLAEIYVQSLSLAIERGEVKGETRFITTRFGNVLGSNGSVIPRFREQIAQGGPVTVTHPDIIRYFMTIPEACRLVLEAGTMGKGGEIFIFDMGEPVKIADLAKRMIELSGLQVDKDIEIKYTGLRPGEKLYEELLNNKENTKETPHEKIRVAAVREYDYKDVITHIHVLIELSLRVQILPMVREMKSFVPEFKSQNSRFAELD